MKVAFPFNFFTGNGCFVSCTYALKHCVFVDELTAVKKCAELFVRLASGEHPDFPDGHDDKTHFNAYGAQRICELVVEGLKRFPFTEAFLK